MIQADESRFRHTAIANKGSHAFCIKPFRARKQIAISKL